MKTLNFSPILVALIGLLATNAGAQAQTLPVAERIANRMFPSIFMAWSLAEGLEISRKENIAKHDLAFMGPGAFGMRWNHEHTGLADGFEPETIAEARQTRQKLLALNPNLILLAEIRYRDAWDSYLPADHEWWMRNESGERVVGWAEGNFYRMDVSNPAFHKAVAMQAEAAIESGVFDGVMLDWWSDEDGRIELIQTIREAIGEDALVIANANDRQTPESAPYINGYFMECWRSQTPEHWRRIAETLLWAEANLREPRINCIETWYETSRQDLNRMRATTTLALTHSEGYCLFSDPNDLPTPDHKHDWYSFWDVDLGRPAGPGIINESGFARREYENGTAIYNPMGNEAVTYRFMEDRLRVSTNKAGREFTIEPLDGDIFLNP